MTSGGWNRGKRTGTTAICPCGTQFYVQQSQATRKKYCCNECKYRYRKRRSGLKYNLVKENKGWFHLRQQQ